MSARIVWWISLGGIVLVLILAIAALVCLTAVTIFGGWFPQVAPGGAQSAAAMQGQTANTPTLEQSLSIAERNTAWASYVVTAVGVLFTVVAIVTTLTNEIRSSRMEERWAQVEPELTKAIDKAHAGVSRLEHIEQGMYRTVVPMAEFMVSNALLELMYPDPAGTLLERCTILRRTAHDGIKLLVEQEPRYERKEAAVRRLSRIIHPSTRDCLNEIERMVQEEFQASKERDGLLSVIRFTRRVVAEALDSQERSRNATILTEAIEERSET